MYPSLVIWIVIFPSLVLYYLKKSSTALSNPNIKKRYGFLYQGYKETHYYWFLVFFKICFWDSSVNVRALIVLLILAISIYLQISKKPYRSADLNEMEFRSTLVSLLTIYLGLLYIVTQELQYEALIFVLIIGINLYFMIFWFTRIFVSYSGAACFHYIPKLQNYLLKLNKGHYFKNFPLFLKIFIYFIEFAIISKFSFIENLLSLRVFLNFV